jgi:hypothetical protein
VERRVTKIEMESGKWLQKKEKKNNKNEKK